MTTASELVTKALGKVLVRSADIPLEADELADGIDQLNTMMAGWNLSALTWTAVTSGSDDLTVPAYAENAMIMSLAELLAPDYGTQLTPAFDRALKTAMKDMRKQAITISRTPFPSTLPQGSGNNRYLNDREFYPPSAAEIANT